MTNNISYKVIITLYNFFNNLKPLRYHKLTSRELICIKGVLRWYFILDSIHKQLCEKNLKTNSLIHLTLMCGIFQIRFLAIRNDIVVNEIINAAKMLKLTQLTGLLNATLRRAEQIKINDFTDDDSMLASMIKQDWPSLYQRVILANLSEPTQTLKYFSNIPTNVFQILPQGAVIVPNNINPSKLFGFSQGDFYIQGAASQFLSHLLPNKSNLKILDCCCGAGGKSFLIKQFYNNCELTSMDISSKQISRLKENINRLKIYPNAILCCDFLKYSEHKFDLIVLDAPCTASGNIRKHPELKFRITAEEIKRITNLQEKMLIKAWALLKPGGTLIYSTCSLLKSENDAQIEKLIIKFADAKLDKEAKIPVANATDFGQQIIAKEHYLDFFFSKINKTVCG